MKAKSAKDHLKTFFISVIVLAILLAAAFAILIAFTQGAKVVSNDEVVFEVSDKTHEDEKDNVLTPPLYSQDDERWAYYEYGSSNVSDCGCGLCVYASALSFLKNDEDITPLTVLEQVGNNCMVYSDSGTLVNDISLFGQWSDEAYGVVVSEIYWTPEQAMQSLHQGKLVICCVDGDVGNESYDGHLVLLYEKYGRIQMLDPKSSNNGGLTEDEFWQADWVYFYNVYLKERGE